MWLWPACTTIEMEALYGFITTPPHTSRRIEPLNAVKTGQINTKSSRVAKNAGRGSSQKKGLTPAEKRATSKRLNPSQQKRSGNKSRQTSPPSKPAVKKVIGDFAAEEFEYGISAAQGLRETMEDEAVVFESGKCGYMYASEWEKGWVCFPLCMLSIGRLFIAKSFAFMFMGLLQWCLMGMMGCFRFNGWQTVCLTYSLA